MTNANACTDPDNCRLCKALHLPGASTEGLYHAGIPLGDHADERARLRALAEKAANPELDHWQRTHALWELRTSITSDVVLRLLDDVERAERERDRYDLQAQRIMLERNTERARAERLEAALKPIAGWWKIWNAGGPTPDEWIVREWMQKADAALAEPAPGGQDAERAEGGA